MILLSSLIRKLAGVLEVTNVGKEFLNIVNEYGTLKKKDISLSNKANWLEVTDAISEKSLKVLDDFEGHGISKEKAEEVRDKIKGLKKRGNPIELLEYLKNFALAWKARSFSAALYDYFEDIARNVTFIKMPENLTDKQWSELSEYVNHVCDNAWFAEKGIETTDKYDLKGIMEKLKEMKKKNPRIVIHEPDLALKHR